MSPGCKQALWRCAALLHHIDFGRVLPWLAFLPLPVIPHLKLTDRGYVAAGPDGAGAPDGAAAVFDGAAAPETSRAASG